MLIILIGGSEVKTLCNQVRKVIEMDNWNKALDKISRGIEGQINQVVARFKSRQRIPQSEEGFTEWYPYVRNQAEQCNWPGYDADAACSNQEYNTVTNQG